MIVIIENQPIIKFDDLPGAEYFLEEHSHEIDFTSGDAELTLVSIGRVINMLERAVACEEELRPASAPNTVDMKRAIHALKVHQPMPGPILVAFKG